MRNTLTTSATREHNSRRSGSVAFLGCALVFVAYGCGSENVTRPAPQADAGIADAAARSCDDPVAPFPNAFAPRCANATRACIASCAFDTCVTDCLQADPTPPLSDPSGVTLTCVTCLTQQQFFCLDNTECQGAVSALFCCAAESCTPTDEDCLTRTCMAQVTAVNECAQASGAACVNLAASAFDLCYAEAETPEDTAVR